MIMMLFPFKISIVIASIMLNVRYMTLNPSIAICVDLARNTTAK